MKSKEYDPGYTTKNHMRYSASAELQQLNKELSDLQAHRQKELKAIRKIRAEQ